MGSKATVGEGARPARKTRLWVLAAAAVLLLAGYLALERLRGGPGLPQGERSVNGPGAPVEILFDSLGVPHIWAASVRDAYYGQGYVHAKQRLWQMEMFRRVAEGRLSELFGDATVETDVFLRKIGMDRLAEASLDLHSPEFRDLMDGYSAGVNAALEDWEGPLPPEFVLLRARPEPWTPRLVSALEKIMAWDLAEFSVGISMGRARDALGDSLAATLLPSYPDWAPTIVGGWPEAAGTAGQGPIGGQQDQGGSRTPVTSLAVRSPFPQFPPAPSSSALHGVDLPAGASEFLTMGSTVMASNSWVVGGERSSSGKPLLANDMHLGMDAPNIWFLVGLHAPGLDVVGMSLPGAPGVVAGHSRAVAWGFTNATLDDSDFFIERVDSADASLYLTPAGPRPFQVREEEIHVRGGETVTVRVWNTRNGPVLTQGDPAPGDEVMSFRWQGAQASRTHGAILEINQARSVEDLLRALEDFRNPHQNVVFADTAGTWGYWMGGRVPLRASGGPTVFPVPGWTGEHDWVGELPFEEHPHVLMPDRGYVVTANNAQGHDSVAYLVNDGGWARPYRAMRISELLEARAVHDAESMALIQMDVVSAFVRRYRSRAVEAFRAEGLTSEADLLEGWDGGATIPSRGAALFNTWVEALHGLLREELYGPEGGYFPQYMVERALDRGGAGVTEASRKAARQAASSVDNRAWGEIHTLTLEHPLAGVPVVSSLLGFGRSGIARQGSTHTVNVSIFTGRTPPFTSVHGPSQRHVVDMADVDDTGGFILPGGQSGFPGSSHAFDQLGRWQRGELWRLPLARPAVEARTVARLRLVPRD